MIIIMVENSIKWFWSCAARIYELQSRNRNRQNGQKVEHVDGGCPACGVCDHRGHWRHKLPMRWLGAPLSEGLPPHLPGLLAPGTQNSALPCVQEFNVPCSGFEQRIGRGERRALRTVSKEEEEDMFVKWSVTTPRIACCGILIVVLSFTPWTGWVVGVK